MKFTLNAGHILIAAIVAVAAWFIYKGYVASQAAPPAGN